MRQFSDEIFVIGAGAMAEAFIRGLTEQHAIAPEKIRVINRGNQERIDALQRLYGISAASSFAEIAGVRVVVVAVKPADVASALAKARPYLTQQVVLSFAAGVSMEFLREASGGDCPVVRTMPNIPVAVLAGATAVSFGPRVTQRDRDDLLFLLEQVGLVEEIPEDKMDAATAFSGSGPGFVSYFLEAMEDAAVKLGFAPEVARRLLLQTVQGTAQTLIEWQLSPRELRHRVTSPGGTTAAGVASMEGWKLPEAVADALQAAATRSKEMGQQYVTRQ